MAPRFLGKTALDGLDLLQVSGQPMLDRHASLRDLLLSRAPAAAGLFAEPVGNWNDPAGRVVSWYTEASSDPEIMAALPPDRRSQMEAQLRSVMAALAPLLADPQTGPELRRALVLPSREAIKVVDGRVVLTEWGMVPAGTTVPADPLSISPLAARLPPTGTAAGRPPPTPMPAAPMPVPRTPPAMMGRPVRGVWNWWLLPAGIVVAVLFLVLGLWVGARMVAERVARQPATVALFDETAARAALEQQKQQNAVLEREVEERRRAMSGNVCTADPAQMPHTGPRLGGPVPPAAAPTPAGGQPFRGTLAELLTQSVVLVLSVKREGAETGSGFFISPDLIVTNRHVVEDAEEGKVVVTGGKLSRATPAAIIAQTPTSEIGQLDLALLRVPAAVAGVQPLAMSSAASALDPVVAAGFPGLTMRGDEAFGRLLEGDLSAVPTIILTDGKISAVQTSPAGVKIMPHTAAVSGGNSGGPLVDACGRVVGVNTFITADRDQVAHNNYAQKSDAVLAFLRANHAEVVELNDPCVPSPPGAAPPAATAPGAAPPASVPVVPAAAAPPQGTSPIPPKP